MLTAYFDESETPSGATAHHFMISGYVSDERGWRAFELKWSHALVCDGFQNHGIHWTDLVAGRGDFASLAGQPGSENFKKRERLQRKYISILRRANLAGIYSAFDMADFDRALTTIRSIRPSKRYRLAYYHAFESVIGALCKFLRTRRILDANEKIAFVFDKNTQTSEHATSIYNGIIKDKRVSFWEHLGPISFADMRRVLPLQAADILANELQRDLVRGTNPRRAHFENLLSTGVVPFHFTRDMFERFAAGLRDGVAQHLASKTRSGPKGATT